MSAALGDEGRRNSVEKVLVTLFFWRSLDLEGGAGLVAGVVKALERQGCSVTLLVPTSPQWSPGTARVVPYLAGTALGTAVRYLRRLRAESKRVDAVLLLENSPTSHLLLSPFLPVGPRTWVHISSPSVGFEILRLGLLRQYVSHGLAKSRVLARIFAKLFGFRLPHYVVSTDYQRAELIDLGCPPERAEIVPFGVDPELFRPSARDAPEAGRLVVGYLGHFSPIKGVPVLIEAYETAAAMRPGIELRLAWSGKGAEAEQVLAAIAPGLESGRIRLLGRVDVARFLDEIDVIVLPFRSASIPHLPLVLLEAFAMGVPVVTTGVGGLGDAVVNGATGFIVPQGDVAELSRVLVRLCDAPDLRHRMRERILAECPARFSSERFCRAFTDRMARESEAGANAA